jgi:3-deoxy-D-manno-octulosonic-acid transferase
VGKSLTAQGGQNPIEPAALSKPILFGPHMNNFAAISSDFLPRVEAIQVKGVDDLTEAFAMLLSNPDKATAMGKTALAVVRENLGAIERTVAMVVRIWKALMSTLRRRSRFVVAPRRGDITAQGAAQRSPGKKSEKNNA